MAGEQGPDTSLMTREDIILRRSLQNLQPHPMINDPRQVLLPVDGSESSKRAMSWYMANIFRPSDVIHLYHICEPSYAANNFSLTTLGQSKTNEINAMLQEHIELSNTLSHDFLSRLESRGVSGDFTLTVGTKPGEMIVSQARDLNADLIVMGSRGVSALKRTVFGSVSDYVLHHSSVPLTVVPSPRREKDFRRDWIRLTSIHFTNPLFPSPRPSPPASPSQNRISYGKLILKLLPPQYLIPYFEDARDEEDS
uniref:Universal stress protein in QAH:OAS n=1 Tax=Echinococcus granulosus TaxID=6210 RepID=A0A068WF79_ECHGR|nr:universal stress protein in QAH:OAS [Echinococcus granulosus]